MTLKFKFKTKYAPHCYFAEELAGGSFQVSWLEETVEMTRYSGEDVQQALAKGVWLDATPCEAAPWLEPQPKLPDTFKFVHRRDGPTYTAKRVDGTHGRYFEVESKHGYPVFYREDTVEHFIETEAWEVVDEKASSPVVRTLQYGRACTKMGIELDVVFQCSSEEDAEWVQKKLREISDDGMI